MVDWYPTLLKLAGASTEQKLKPDGLDIWPTITQGKPTPHDAILINSIPESGAIRMGDWKLVVNGHIGANDLEAAKKKSTTKNAAKQSKDSRSATVESSIELFNLRQDPFETTNLAKGIPIRFWSLKPDSMLTRRRPFLRKPNPRRPTSKHPRSGAKQPSKIRFALSISRSIDAVQIREP